MAGVEETIYYHDARVVARVTACPKTDLRTI
jgi:hypothetical protein